MMKRMNKKSKVIAISAALTLTLASCDTTSLALMTSALDLALTLIDPSYSSSGSTSGSTSSALYGSSAAAFQPTATSGSTVGTSGSNAANLESMYRMWENRARANYDSLTNLGTKTKKNGKDAGGSTGQSMSSSNYTSMKSSLREAQREMASIRRKAASQGVTIIKSEYEDIQVSY